MTHHNWTRRRLAGMAGAILAVGLLAGPLSTTAGASTGPAPSQGAPAVVCPATEGTPRFVRFIYLNILFRCPDTASMDYWVGRIDGGLSRSRFAELVDLSSENLTLNNVFPLYGDILGREPSIVELQAGVDSIRTHQADSRLIAELASSDEFFNALDPGMEDRGDFWLTTAYQSILDRDPDPAGFDFYRALMGTPSTATGRLKVARALELSAREQRWVDLRRLLRRPQPAARRRRLRVLVRVVDGDRAVPHVQDVDPGPELGRGLRPGPDPAQPRGPARGRRPRGRQQQDRRRRRLIASRP